MKNVKLKEVLLRVVDAENGAVEDLVSYKDKWVVELIGGKSKRYLKRETRYTVPGIHKFYLNCIESFSKLSKPEVESLFQSALNEFVYNVIAKKNPNKAKELSETALIDWVKKYIKGYILREMDKTFGKVNIDRDTGQIIDKEINILSENVLTGQHLGDDEDTTDSASLYNVAAFEKWNRKNTYISFSDFMKDMNFDEYIKELLSETEYKVYPKLVKKYQVENERVYGNTHIAKELNVGESRIRQIEEKIGNKLHKLYQLWINTRKRKNTPLSHEIRDFLQMFDHVINSLDDENLQFEMLIGWLKTQIEKEKQVNIEELHNNKVDEIPSIINLICDGDTELKEVLLSLDKQLHKSTYMTVCGILEGSIESSSLRKEFKRTIITKCLSIFYAYLNGLDKDVKRIVKYNNTYQATKKNNDYINKGHTDGVGKHFNKIVNLIS